MKGKNRKSVFRKDWFWITAGTLSAVGLLGALFALIRPTPGPFAGIACVETGRVPSGHMFCDEQDGTRTVYRGDGKYDVYFPSIYDYYDNHYTYYTTPVDQ